MSTPPPKMSRAMERADGADAAQQPTEPPASELAEALFLAIQALKSTGRECAEEAGPELRAISMARGRVLEAFAQAEAEEGGVSLPAGTLRGHHRMHTHEVLAAQFGHHQRVRMSDLAQMLGVTARNITTIVDGLEHEGLLARRKHPDDRRAFLLELTEKGRAQIAQIHALHRATAERFFAPLDATERAELLRLLAKVRDGASTEASAGDGDGGHTDTPNQTKETD